MVRIKLGRLKHKSSAEGIKEIHKIRRKWHDGKKDPDLIHDFMKAETKFTE